MRFGEQLENEMFAAGLVGTKLPWIDYGCVAARVGEDEVSQCNFFLFFYLSSTPSFPVAPNKKKDNNRRKTKPRRVDAASPEDTRGAPLSRCSLLIIRPIASSLPANYQIAGN